MITFRNLTNLPLEFSQSGFLVPPGELKTVESTRRLRVLVDWLVSEGTIEEIAPESVGAAPKRARKTSPAPTGKPKTTRRRAPKKKAP